MQPTSTSPFSDGASSTTSPNSMQPASSSWMDDLQNSNTQANPNDPKPTQPQVATRNSSEEEKKREAEKLRDELVRRYGIPINFDNIQNWDQVLTTLRATDRFLEFAMQNPEAAQNTRAFLEANGINLTTNINPGRAGCFDAAAQLTADGTRMELRLPGGNSSLFPNEVVQTLGHELAHFVDPTPDPNPNEAGWRANSPTTYGTTHSRESYADNAGNWISDPSTYNSWLQQNPTRAQYARIIQNDFAKLGYRLPLISALN